MKLLSKTALYHTFLIGDHPAGDFKVYQRSAHSEKEFQADKKAVLEY